jgi:hypothetical protein
MFVLIRQAVRFKWVGLGGQYEKKNKTGSGHVHKVDDSAVTLSMVRSPHITQGTGRIPETREARDSMC